MTTNTALTPIATVTAIYEAFGRGDIETILGLLAADVSWDADWADNFAQRTPLGHFAPRRGHDGVLEWFGALRDYTVNEIQLVDLMSGTNTVVAQVTVDLSTPSGGRLRDEELHLWTIGPDGLVTALRHYIDTAKHLAASRGEDTTIAP